MPAGGYFGRALVADAGAGIAETLPLTDELLRAYIGGGGGRAPARGTRRPAPPPPRGPPALRVPPARRPPADHERQVRRRGQVPADRHADRRARLQPVRDRR